jgi:hypothetical protein
MSELAFRVGYNSREEAEEVARDLKAAGARTETTEEPGLLPLAVLLVVAIPPGAALLVRVVDRIVHGWRDHGILIDARGTGEPAVIKNTDLPYGTVVILTRDGEKAERSDLAEDDLSKYVSAALGAVAGGASAPDANDAGTDASS